MKPLGHLLATVVVGFFSFFALQEFFATTIEVNLLFIALMLFAGWAPDVVQGMEFWWMAFAAAAVLGFFAGSEIPTSGGAEGLLVSIVFALLFAGVILWLRKRRPFTHYGYYSSFYALAYGALSVILTRDFTVGILAVVLVRMHSLIDNVYYAVLRDKSKHALQEVQALGALALIASIIVFFMSGSRPEVEAVALFTGAFLIFFNLISLAFNFQPARVK